MMQMMTAPTPDGSQIPMMARVAKVVHPDSIAIGWLYHLFKSAFIGGMFGWAFGKRVTAYASATGYGVARDVSTLLTHHKRRVWEYGCAYRTRRKISPRKNAL
jgi:hypothetical protein